MSKYQLLSRLFGKNEIHVWEASNRQTFKGTLIAIQREDGSGNCFNVTIGYRQNGVWCETTFFVRTID